MGSQGSSEQSSGYLDVAPSSSFDETSFSNMPATRNNFASERWFHSVLGQNDAIKLLKETKASGAAANFVVRIRKNGGYYLTLLNHATDRAWQAKLTQPGGTGGHFCVKEVPVEGVTTLTSLVNAFADERAARRAGLPCALVM